MHKQDLLPGVYRSNQASRRARRGWAVAVVLSGLFAGGAVVASLLHRPAAQSGGVTERIAVAERRGEESQRRALVLGNRLAQQRQATQAVDAVAGQPNWGVLLDRVSKELGGEVFLTSCIFAPGDAPSVREAAGLGPDTADSAWLVLAGIAQDYPEVPALLLRLEGLGVFEKVELVETWREPFGSEARIGFRVACRVR